MSQAWGRCLKGQGREAGPHWECFSIRHYMVSVLLVFVASMYGESVVMQIEQGTDLSLHWPFYSLWVNIVVAITTSELRGVAIMTASNRWMRGLLPFPTACSLALCHLLAPQTLQSTS